MQVVECLGTVEAADRIVFTEFPEPSGADWTPDPTKPGLGLELEPAAVARYAVD